MQAKTVLWMRHGKSDWDADYGGDDHERPLARRGVRAARSMGAALRDAGMVPDLVLTSTAVRARTTAELAAESGAWNAPMRADRDLYFAGVDAVLDALRQVDDAYRTVLVAGHEPVWSDGVAALIGGGSVRMVTAAVACVTLDVARWSDVRPGCGTLRWLLPPKLLAKLRG